MDGARNTGGPWRAEEPAVSADLCLKDRLGKLPNPVRSAFQQLRQLGHLTDDVLVQVLDAGDLAGDSKRLLGFAVTYLQLCSQSVPMKDTIQMAKALGRRLNLQWSASRWSNEHDRLARMMSLKRLAEENCRYDLAAYEGLMPARLPGYLIRSSRRLGMEGLRQRHCVADYHSLLQSGACAIASVFVNHQRWTVQLYTSGNTSRRLRVGQVKTRLNADAPKEVRATIRAMFGDVGDPTAAPAPVNERG